MYNKFMANIDKSICTLNNSRFRSALWNLQPKKIIVDSFSQKQELSKRPNYHRVDTGEDNPIILWQDNNEIMYIWINKDCKIQAPSDSSELFYSLYNLESIDLSIFDLSKIENAYAIFSSCSRLKQIKLINLQKIKNLKFAFDYCTELERIDFVNCDFNNLFSLEGTFSNCKNLKTIFFSGYEAPNLLTTKEMCFNCMNLKSFEFFNSSPAPKIGFQQLLNCVNCEELSESEIKELEYESAHCGVDVSIDWIKRINKKHRNKILNENKLKKILYESRFKLIDSTSMFENCKTLNSLSIKEECFTQAKQQKMFENANHKIIPQWYQLNSQIHQKKNQRK